MKKQLFVLVAILVAASMVLAGCGGTKAATQAATTGPVLIRWSIGVGTGADPAQVTIENDVATDFNKSQDKIKLVIEVIPNASARDTIATEIAAGAGPDIVGPVGWLGSNAFAGQWLDLAPYIKSTNYDTSKFDPAMVKSYQTEGGTVGLPFAVYPSAIYYNTGLFQEAGLNPPPAKYGDQYKMPDGSMVDWSWDTLTKVAQMLTIDKAGKNSTQDGFDAASIVQYVSRSAGKATRIIGVPTGRPAPSWSPVDPRAATPPRFRILGRPLGSGSMMACGALIPTSRPALLLVVLISTAATCSPLAKLPCSIIRPGTSAALPI